MPITETERPYELLVRYHASGSIFAHYKTIREVMRDGVVIAAEEGSPQALAAADVADLVGEFLPAALAERDAAIAQRDELRAEVAEQTAQIDALIAEVDRLRGAAPSNGRRLIAKSTVQERVNAVGKLGAAFAILQADPISFGRWFAPDWPNVYFDDPGLLAVLEAAGCTPEEIAAITA